MTPKTIVVVLFGTRGTARICGITGGAVSQWPENRIPGRHHQRLLDAAKRQGLLLTPADLILGRKRCLNRNGQAKAAAKK